MEEKAVKEIVTEKWNKKRFFFFIRFSIVLLLLLMILLYFLTPISRVSDYTLTGNYYLTSDEVLDILWLKRDSYLFRIDENQKEELLNEHPLIRNGKISISPFSFSIDIDELSPCLIEDENVLLSDRSILDEKLYQNALVGEKLKEIQKRIPRVLTPLKTFEFNTSVQKILMQLSLYLVSKENLDLDYCDYVPDENGVDGTFEFYFPCISSVKEELFNEKEGEILFLFRASCVQYHQDHYSDGLSFLASNLAAKFTDILEIQDAQSAALEERDFFGQKKWVRIFKVELNGNELVIRV